MASDGIPPDGWWYSIPVLAAIFGWMHKLRSNSKNEIDELRRNLEAHRIEVATKRASNHYVAEVENRMTNSMTDIKAAMVRMESKLDRVIENHPKQSN